MANTKVKTLISTLQEYVPYYLAKYVEWYMTPDDKRVSWEELCTCDANYKRKDCDEYKTQEFCESNWLIRSDVQAAMQAYLKYFKKSNLTMLYKSMYDKALKGDVRAADWIVKFSEGEFFDESTDEIDSFLSSVNIPKIKGE